MPKTTAENILKTLDEGYDPIYIRGLYKQQLYAFGDDWAKQRQAGFTRGRLVECPDITIHQLEVGVSRRILNAQFISLSRVAYSQPDPVFTDVDRWIGEVRKQFFLARGDSEGDPDGEWGMEDAMAYMDGDGLGIGGVQIVLNTNAKTGLQRIGVQHIPVTNIIWDRLERNPGRAAWMAFVHHLSPEDAAARFGQKVADKYVRSLYEGMTGSDDIAHPIMMMRIIEYFDMGLGKKGSPTRAVIADDLDGEILEHGDNPFGCIPFAHYVHFVAPGMRRPVGRVMLQMATQEALNEVERHMRACMNKIPIDLVDTDQIYDEDLTRINDGDFDGPPIRWTPTGQGVKPWERIPGTDAQETTLAWSNMLERQFTTDSGTSEFERGNFSQTSRTLGENQLVDERSQVQGVWSKLQMTQFQRRKVAKVLQIAKLFDRDPVLLNIFGHPVLVNDPQNPTSSIAGFLTQASRVVIDADSMEFSDLMMQRQQKLAELSTIQDLVATGWVNPEWYAQEKLTAIGYDPNEAMRDAPATQPQPQQPQDKEIVSINYADAPADIQRQMEAQAGFQPSKIPLGVPGSNVQPPAPALPPAGPAAPRPRSPQRR